MNKKAVLTLKIVTAFSAAAVVAGTMTYSYRTADKKKLENNDGLGGLEISAVPQYDTQEKIENSVSENVSDAEFIETDSVQDRKDLLALEEAEKKLIDGGLYYSSYRIKKGDMIGVIAEKYGISQDTLISVNKIRATRTIQIGQNIKIPSLDGILYTVKKDGETPETIAEKYEVSADEVANVNKIAVNASLDAGQSVFVPGAELDWITAVITIPSKSPFHLLEVIFDRTDCKVPPALFSRASPIIFIPNKNSASPPIRLNVSNILITHSNSI